MTLGETILGVAVLMEKEMFQFRGMLNIYCLTERDVGMKNDYKEKRKIEKGQQAIVLLSKVSRTVAEEKFQNVTQ